MSANNFLKFYHLDEDVGKYFYSFRGIPYAKAPVKGRRFQVGPRTRLRLIILEGSQNYGSAGG
jgi:hypothetical protein